MPKLSVHGVSSPPGRARLAVLHGRRRLPAEHRRPSRRGLAGVGDPRLRERRSCAPRSGRSSGCSPSTPALSSGLQRTGFVRASRDRFFLCIEKGDPRLSRRRARLAARARGRGSHGGAAVSPRGRTMLALLLGAAGVACRQDMHDRPKYRPLREGRPSTGARPVPSSRARSPAARCARTPRISPASGRAVPDRDPRSR